MERKMTKEPELWGVGEEIEVYEEKTRDEVIEEYLDQCLIPGASAEQVLESLPGTLQVVGAVREEITLPLLYESAVLEHLLGMLDDEYGNPEEATAPTEAMINAARNLVTVVLQDYEVWTCTEVVRETVDVPAWVRENRPDWLMSVSERCGATLVQACHVCEAFRCGDNMNPEKARQSGQ
jgi:hypothetical protein